MTVVVSFIKQAARGSEASGVGQVRVRENIAIPGTTTATLQDGELVIVGNAETSMVAVAFGTTPDAAALAKTGATSAGMPVAAGALSYPIIPAVGDKINVKVVT
jgi:hypothetical protein